MVNENVALDQLTQLLTKLRNQRTELTKSMVYLEDQIQSVEKTMNLYRQTFTNEEPQKYSNLASNLKGLTLLKAMINLALSNMGQIVMKQAKPILLEVGILKNSKTALASMYATADRSGKFEKVSPGIYKLISEEQNKLV